MSALLLNGFIIYNSASLWGMLCAVFGSYFVAASYIFSSDELNHVVGKNMSTNAKDGKVILNV